MGLFGGSAARQRELNARIDELQREIDKLRGDVKSARDEVEQQRRVAAEKSEAATQAIQARKRAEEKSAKLGENREAADKATAELKSRIDTLQREAAEYRTAMLSANARAEELLARRADLERSVTAAEERAKKAESERSAAERAAAERPRPAPVQRGPDAERLEAALTEARAERDALRDRVNKAERTAREADDKRKQDSHLAQTVLRELQHNLRAERKAYRILQLQYEAQIDVAKGIEQLFKQRIGDAEHETIERVTAETRKRVEQELREGGSRRRGEPKAAPAPAEETPTQEWPQVGGSEAQVEESSTAPWPALPAQAAASASQAADDAAPAGSIAAQAASESAPAGSIAAQAASDPAQAASSDAEGPDGAAQAAPTPAQATPAARPVTGSLGLGLSSTPAPGDPSRADPFARSGTGAFRLNLRPIPTAPPKDPTPGE